MVQTPSNMMALDTKAPDFTLPEPLTGNMVNIEQLKATHGLVVMFICNHCPYVIHINEQIVSVAERYIDKGFDFVAISSNDVENYPQDKPELMARLATELNFPFPYLYDESQAIAKAYQAACTPDFYVFDHDLSLKYRGQFDDSRPGNGVAITGDSLSQALDCMLNNTDIPPEQKPSLGCNIKWK